MQNKRHIKFLAGNANPALAKSVSQRIGVGVTPLTVEKFKDGEIYVRVLESVRGCDVFILQPTCPPVNENLMELLIITDALKRASAHEITAVIPYYGYSRQDRKALPREPISARLVTDMIKQAGVDRIVTFDLHVEQIQGFFDGPWDNLEARPVLVSYLLKKNLKNPVIVSPDSGGVTRARRFIELLGGNLAIVFKRRSEHNKVKLVEIIGNVKGRDAVIVDDIIDTAGSITLAAREIKKRGAKRIYAVATHGLFSSNAIRRLENSPIDEVVITDSIPLSSPSKIVKVVSISGMISRSIQKIYSRQPMGIMMEKLYGNIIKRKDVKKRR